MYNYYIKRKDYTMWTTPTNDKEKQLVLMAANTGGYFTAKQALETGYSYRLQHYHKEKGHWEEIDRGVFRLADYPNSPYEDLIRWSLWSRNRDGIPQAVISHETALTVHESGDTMPGKTHFTVPPGFRKDPPGGCILHYAPLGPEVIQSSGGFYVTNPIQTIVDVAEGDMSADHLESAVRDMYAKGLILFTDFQNVAMSPQPREKINTVIQDIQRKPFFNVSTAAKI